MAEGRFYWVEDFVREQFSYEPVIADRILAKGEKMLVLGPSESGKSYLLLQMAMEIATGGTVFGRDVARPFRTLLVQSEVTEGEYQERVKRLLASYAERLEPEMLAVVTTENGKVNTVDGLRLLTALVKVVQPEVVIFDPLRAFVEGDENDSSVGDAFFAGIATLQRQGETPFTFIAAHHVRKPGMDGWDDGKYAARGSGIWTDRPSTVLVLSVNSAQTEWGLKYVKTRARGKHPADQRLVVDWGTGLFDVVMDGSAAIRMDVVRRHVSSVPRPASDVKDAIAEECKVSHREVERWLVVAERDGVIEKAADAVHRSRRLIRLHETKEG